MKLIEQVQQRHNATQITGGSSAHLIPQTPSMTARHLHPGLASYSSTPGATPSLTPPRTFMSSLQVCTALCIERSPLHACTRSLLPVKHCTQHIINPDMAYEACGLER